MTNGNRWRRVEMGARLGFKLAFESCAVHQYLLYLLQAQEWRKGANVRDSPLVLPPCTFSSTQSSGILSDHLIAVGRESLALAPIFGPVFQLCKAFLFSAASFSASVLTTEAWTLSEAFLPQQKFNMARAQQRRASILPMSMRQSAS